MATKILDSGVYARSATYTGPGQIDGNCRNSATNHNMLTGDFTSDGSDVLITLGFKPRRITVVNETDGITYMRLVGMAAANSVKFVLGGSLAGTKDTGSAIVETDGGSGNYSVTIPAATAGTSKHIVFCIEG